MQIISWNVNSLKIRQQQVIDYFHHSAATVMALQEIKQQEHNIDYQSFKQQGWHVAAHSQKSYNGVLLLAKEELKDIYRGFDAQARLIAATVNDVRIINIYVPNGKALHDEKYQYKLAWLQQLQQYVIRAQRNYSNIVIIGDFNIIPEDIDSYNPLFWRDKIFCSQRERAALQALIDCGFSDAFRVFNGDKQQFSWWDYRRHDWQHNRGLRIDLSLCSNNLKIKNAFIDPLPRNSAQPSDHAPISLQIHN